jgi:undecaprenyl-diphosphatase
MGWLIRLDETLFHIINIEAANTILDLVMPFISSLGNMGFVWIILTLVFVVLGDKKGKQVGILAFFAFMLAHLLTNRVIKLAVCRPRPFLVMEHVRLLIEPPDSFSFPSGHASLGTTWAVTNYKLKGYYRNIVLILALAIGFSRIYVGVHYPFDVLAGYLMGLVCSTVVIRFYKMFNKNKTSA